MAPHATGRGNGNSAANAADYLDATFWKTTVQPSIATSAETVWFADGIYDRGQLKLTAFGHPLHKITLRATTADSVTMSAKAQSILWLYGCQNVEIDDLRFTGPSTQGAVNLSYYPTILKSGTHDIAIKRCRFENLTQLSFGAVLFGVNHNITIDSCHFSNVTGPAPKQVHAIYVGRSSTNVRIVNSDFTDIGGEYVRFRDDSEFGVVDHCSFHSTAEAWNSPFITLPLFNSRKPHADEFFGTHFQFSNNTFRYDFPNASPAKDCYCFAHYFYDSGFNVKPGEGLDYMVDAKDADILNGPSVPAKEALLRSQMGLSNTQLHITNPDYHGVVKSVAYRGYGADNQGHSEPVDISDWPGSGALAAVPLLRNGAFEFKGNRLRGWTVFSGNPPTDFPGLNGTSKAIKLSQAAATEVGQWLSPVTPGRLTIHCLFAVGQSPGSGVKFQLQIYHNEISNSYLAVAVDDSGQLGVMNGAAFVPVPALGAIDFSKTTQAADEPLKWYQLRIDIDYTTAPPTYRVARGVANKADDYTYSATGLTSWVNGAPPAGSKAGLLNFANSGADVVIDEVW